VRSNAEVVDDTQEAADSVEDESFSQEEIIQTTRLARDHAFRHFDSGRASNTSYEDTQFFELQTFMGMVRCGTAQGAARFQYRRGKDYGPHGDTHLRAVKQFDPALLKSSAVDSFVPSIAQYRLFTLHSVSRCPYSASTGGLAILF